jgi:hypothetical protein
MRSRGREVLPEGLLLEVIGDEVGHDLDEPVAVA